MARANLVAMKIHAPAIKTTNGGGNGETEPPSELERGRLVELVGHLIPAPGPAETPWPGLRGFRSNRPTTPNPSVYTPSLCIVAQGSKEARLGDRVFRYDPLNYLVVGAPLPVYACVLRGSAASPFLSIVLEIPTADVRDLLLELKEPPRAELWTGAPPLCVSRMDGRFLGAVNRFLACVLDPLERRVLGKAALREVIYLALRGQQGDLLRLAAQRERYTPGLLRVLSHISRHLEERLEVPALARIAGMSSSSLYEAFRQATTMSPIQYVKRLRLDRARQLMREEGCQAAEAAFRVGYESPSQFSRDFRRHFGLPPKRYLESGDPGELLGPV